jgi:hypothetical protein
MGESGIIKITPTQNVAVKHKKKKQNNKKQVLSQHIESVNTIFSKRDKKTLLLKNNPQI